MHRTIGEVSGRVTGGGAVRVILAVALCSFMFLPSARPETAPLAEVRRFIDDSRFAEAEAAARRLLTEARCGDTTGSLECAEILDHLVEALWRAGKSHLPDTRQLAERALKIKERALGPAHVDVAVSLRNLATVLMYSGESSAARPLYRREIAIQERARGSESLELARSLIYLASLEQEEGNYDAAKVGYGRALAIQERVLGSDDIRVARTLHNLAISYHKTGEYDQARTRYERALAIIEGKLGPQHPDVAWSLNSLGMLSEEMGDFAAAESRLARALAIRETALGPEHLHVAWSLNNLGNLFRNTGDYDRARPLYERALTIEERQLGADHPDVAMTRNNLAEMLYLMGDYAPAKALLDQALKIRIEALGPDHPDVAATLYKIAIVLTETGRYAEARPLYERSIAIQDQKDLTAHPYYALALNDFAALLDETGDDAGARGLYERALDIQRKAVGDDHPGVARSLMGLAKLDAQAGNLATARSLYEEALSIQEKSYGSGHPMVGAVLSGMATLLREMGEPAQSFEAALRAEEISRNDLRLKTRTMADRQALRYASVRSSGLDVALSTATDRVAADAAWRTWDALIRSRALVFEEMAARNRGIAEAADPGVAQLLAQHAAASRRLANLTIRGPDPDHPEPYRDLLASAQEEKERAARALAARSLLFRHSDTTRRIGLKTVAENLPRASALVAFAFYERYPSKAEGRGPRTPAPSYLAFILSSGRKTPTLVKLGSAAEIDTLVSRWRKEITAGALTAGRSSAKAIASYRAAGDALRRTIWDPLSPALAGVERVFLVPDGTLHLVNFYALPDAERGYLIESGPLIHYLSSEKDLVPSKAQNAAGRGLLTLGGPAYDGTVALADHRFAASPAHRSACSGFRSMRFEALPDSMAEIEDINDLWKAAGPRLRGAGDGNTPVVTLAGMRASEPAFKAEAPGKRILHLATHGFFLGGECDPRPMRLRGVGGLSSAPDPKQQPLTVENPLLLSGLALAGANHRDAAGPGEEDGILTAEEIAAMDLCGVQWAVLSACDTGRGEIHSGEGVLGLVRAFRVAGAGTVIMSLWPVEDQSAREWMRNLYGARLLERQDTAESVRTAGLKLLHSGRTNNEREHPFYWAGFVATGDWN